MPRLKFDPDRTLVDLLATAVARDPHGLFAHFEGRPITIGEIDRRSAALAARLRADGLVPGDRVAVMMQNSVAAIDVVFALARAGLVWVPVNPRLRGGGLSHILNHADPALIIADIAMVPTITAAGFDLEFIPLIVHGSGVDGSLETYLQGSNAWHDPPLEPGGDAVIMYTSGTSGPAKGVRVTHGMLRYSAAAVALQTAPKSGDVYFMWEPLCHIGGAQMMVLPLTHGIVLSMVARFSASRFWDQVRAHGASHIHYLGGVLRMLLAQPERPDDRDHPARIAWGAGCTGDTWRAFEARFGVEIRECYGMTEASSVTTYNPDGKVGSIGRELPWFEVSVVAPDGTSCATGVPGEMVVAARATGPLFAGYFRNETATAATLVDGRLHTGDLCSVDGEGYFSFRGRLSEGIRHRGENVSPWEIESVARNHPDVAECAAIGVPSDLGEQDIKLFIVEVATAKTDFKTLAAWLASRLAAYQMPRYFERIDGFHKTPSERIQKKSLSPSIENAWDRLA